jgi:periplasmic protein CpxP/Spy
MRRWVLSAAVLLLSVGMFAQTPTPQDQGPGQGEHQAAGMHRHMDPQQQLDHLTKQLKLTDDQQQKIKPLLEQQAEQMQSVRQDTSVPQQDRRAKFQEIHQNTMSQIRSILDENQQKKFDKMMQRQEERRAHRMGEGGPQGNPSGGNNGPQ